MAVVTPVQADEAVGPVEVPLYGVMGEFESAERLLEATRRAYAAGYRAMDAYSPFPVEGVRQALGQHSPAVPLIALTGGVLGALSGYGLEYWVHAIALPINVGGRPLNSWPAFIPVTFEMGVLFSALFITVGLLILNRLPEPYHPVFNVPGFERASRDRFFLCVEARDSLFEPDRVRRFLLEAGAREVSDVFE